MRISIEEIKSRSEALYVNAGLSKEDAAILTEVLLNTEMRGVFTHGFFRTSYYVRCLQSGGANKENELKIVSDTPSWALVDGNGGIGIILAYKATKLAIVGRDIHQTFFSFHTSQAKINT